MLLIFRKANFKPNYMSSQQVRSSRSKAFGYVLLAYLAALGAAFLSGYYCRQAGLDVLTSIAVADVVGTVVVFGFSYYFNNSSFYDPYWSVIPIFIAAYLAVLGWDGGGQHLRILLLLLLVTFWGIRLTYNWARGWPGLHHQDWRYDDLQAKTGKWYWLVSLLGIHLFPTVLVFLGCLSLYPAMVMPDAQPLNALDAFAFLVTLGAILIELIADEQLRAFVKSRKRPGTTLTTGLWRYSRHPNYFGETAFWWGLFLFAMAAHPAEWWVITGPVSMTLLFNFISIPMIEKRMEKRRENYELIKRAIPRWIPWFPREEALEDLEAEASVTRS